MIRTEAKNPFLLLCISISSVKVMTDLLYSTVYHLIHTEGVNRVHFSYLHRIMK